VKQIALFLITAIGFIPMLRAQCPHNPTITPAQLILCPGASDTLWTQVYDAYQWYRDGQILPGDTLRYRVVSSVDAGSQFSVQARLNGCAELAPPVLVDGWLFLLPVVQTVGLRDTLCLGRDTLTLILRPPYTTSIQWTLNGQPIPGANNDTLLVTQSGDYCVSGAPEICPSFVQTLGVILSYTFIQCGQGTGIEQHGHFDNVILYPNPSRDRLYVDLRESSERPLPWRIFDGLGRTISSGLFDQGEGIDLQPLSSGTYFLELNPSKRVSCHRFVKW
jgi:hypothetical protein